MHSQFGGANDAGHTFKAYPRGFLGPKLQDRVQRDTQLERTALGYNAVGVKSYQKSNGVNDFNHAIQQLYSSYIREEPGVTGFEFRERVLRVALQAFGTSSFNTWYFANVRSPFVGKNHRDFLDDCLRFLSGKRRNLFLENWAALLEIHNADEGAVQPSELALDFFNSGGQFGDVGKRHYVIADVIQDWCSQPNGFEDLLGTLYILFGAA